MIYLGWVALKLDRKWLVGYLSWYLWGRLLMDGNCTLGKLYPQKHKFTNYRPFATHIRDLKKKFTRIFKSNPNLIGTYMCITSNLLIFYLIFNKK